MQSRELHTPDGTSWTLTEALVGTDAEREERGVPVVATPSGGEQTLRLALPADWLGSPDADLADALVAAREDRDTDGPSG